MTEMKEVSDQTIVTVAVAMSHHDADLNNSAPRITTLRLCLTLGSIWIAVLFSVVNDTITAILLGQIATSDIGYFAAQALIQSEEFNNKKLSLAGDEMTYQQFKERFEATTAQQLPTTYWFVARLVNWMSKELGYMFRWFRNVGYAADIASLKKINPELKNFETWLKEESQFKNPQK